MGQQDKREAIAHHGRECESACRLAVFADQEGMTDIAAGLRKLAEDHSRRAFEWAAPKIEPVAGLTHSADPGHYEAGVSA